MIVDETDFRKGVARRVRASILYAFAYHWPVPGAGLDQASCQDASGCGMPSPVFAPTPEKIQLLPQSLPRTISSWLPTE